MYEALGAIDVADVARVGGAGGLLVYATLWLLRRGDRLQRENIDDLRRQRDEWRERAEDAEEKNRHLRREVFDLRSELARYVPDTKDR